MAACVRYIGDSLPVQEVAFFRSFIPILIVAPLILIKKESFFPPPRKPLVIRGVVGTGGLICLLHATQNLPLSISGILVWCTPAVTYITARVVLKEKLGGATLLWLIVAFFGLAVIFFPLWFSEQDMSSAIAQVNVLDFSIGLFGTLFAGLVFVTIRSAAAQHSNNNIVLSFSVAASFITGIWMTFSFTPPSSTLLAVLVTAGVIGTLAQLALTEAYRNAPAALVSSMSLMQAPFAILFGVLIFAEQLTVLHILGIGLMGFGVFQANRAHSRMKG